jgi:PAS domain S-box-containing protein
MISVLYVDDEESLLEIARLFLEETGEFRIGTAISAKDALKDDSIRSYDAIVSDYQMPGMDGIAFLKLVRERFGDIPFILFTGRGREEVVIDAINNGADFYIQKGGDPEAQFAELAHKIRQSVRRKQAEYSLHDSERRLADIIDFLPDATFAIDRSGRVIAWNRAIEDMTGVPASEMLGKADYAYAVPFYGERRPMLIDLIDGPDEKITQYYTKIYRDNTSISAETDHTHPKGHQILVITKVCHLYNQAGQIAGTIESIRDISEHKRLETDLEQKHGELQASYEQLTAAEEELREQYDELAKSEQQIRESETRFRNLIQNSSDMIRIIGRDGRIVYSSPSTLRLFGYDPADMIGTDPLDYIHPDDRAQVKDALRDVFGEINSGVPTEYRIRHKDGHYIDVEAVANNQMGTPGINGIVITTRPVTERKQGEASLRESESRFATVFRKSPVALTLVSATDGKFTDVNDAFTHESGYSREDVIGKTADEVGIFVDRNELGHLSAAMRKQQTVQGLDMKVRRKIGGIRICRFSAGILMMGGSPHILSSVEDVTDYKAAENALRVSEAQYRRLAEHSPDMIYRMSVPEGKYEYVSPVSAVITGYTPEEFYQDPGLIRKLIHPAWQEYFRKEWQALLENRAPPFYEFQIIDRTGNTRWVNQRNMLVMDDEGNPVAIEGIVTDITRQKITERELRRNELRSLAVSGTAGFWIWEVDAEGIYRYSSPAVSKILGYRPDELVGKMHYYDLFDPSAREELKDFALAGFASHEPFRDFVNINRHRNGTPVILSTSATPVFDDEGIFTGYCGVDEDITEKQRAQEELSENRQQLAGAMDLATLVNWEYDVAADRFTFDDRFYALYGTSAEREGGNYMSSETYAREFLHPEDRDLVEREIQKTLDTTDPRYVSYVEHRIIRRDGGIRYISVRIAITKDAGGRTIRTHGANQDITERKQAEEALRQAHKKLHLLTGITRHDISNQLMGLNGFVGLLHKKVMDPSLEDYFSRIREASGQITSMIAFTKEYEKIGDQAPVWQAPATVVNGAAKGILPGQVALKNELPADLDVFADPLIIKVFFNLLDNSIRHGQRVTEIRVSSHRAGENMVMVWEDNGIGIGTDDKERIFERGFGKNTGLGMFLVREILSLTGITITETGEPFAGARFEMVVPRGVWRWPGSGG